MENTNKTSLQSMLEQMPTEQLDEMLREELSKATPDESSVRLILSVLKERDANTPQVITPGVEAAWKEYQMHTEEHRPKARRIPSWMLRIASLAVIVGALFVVVPQEAEAESLWERLVRWTDSIFEFFSKDNQIILEEYAFQTDNPGLQQVYDAVTELGVTFPVVPMWLPEGYEITDCKTADAHNEKYVLSRFDDNGCEAVFMVSLYDSFAPVQYQKDGEQIKQIELHGTVYYLMRNVDRWAVVWSKENVECSFTIDCEEDAIYKILKSIYSMEDGK